MRKLILIFVCMLSMIQVKSQVPFNKGVNLTGWFQVDGAEEIQFSMFTRNDLENIKSLGCNVIRLPIDMHEMTLGSPGYTLDPLYFSLLDSAVTWCEQLQIYLILDNHSTDTSGTTTVGIEPILLKVWSQMASHYKNRSKYVLYEVLNEPNGISTSEWGLIQGNVIDTIRKYDTTHTIVVTGSDYDSYNELTNLPVYADTNLLYTFHFYDPMVFTHQGATWVTPSMAALSGVPFPYLASAMPACPSTLLNTWVESSLTQYPSQGNSAYLRQLINNAIDFRSSRHVNIYCGELGVYMLNSVDSDRCTWYSVVRQYLEGNNIPWTIWDYKGGFGVFKKGSNQIFNNDLNTRLLDSLKLNVPPQVPYVKKPDSTGFFIYTDFFGENLQNISYTLGTLDFYSTTYPEAGQYCIYWTGFAQYNNIGFQFIPGKDLSKLVEDNYALDFMVRGDQPGIEFDVRFMDDTLGGLPWRMRFVIDSTFASWDKKWHHIHLPLSSFSEQGAYYDDTWYNPEGMFDWTRIDNFEVSTEYTNIIGKSVWFDNIYVINVDTAVVRSDVSLAVQTIREYPESLIVYPNPMHENITVSYSLAEAEPLKIYIYDMLGTKIKTLSDQMGIQGINLFRWDGINDAGNEVLPGMYLCEVSTNESSAIVHIIKL